MFMGEKLKKGTTNKCLSIAQKKSQALNVCLRAAPLEGGRLNVCLRLAQPKSGGLNICLRLPPIKGGALTFVSGPKNQMWCNKQMFMSQNMPMCPS